MRWRGITVTGVVIAVCLIALNLASDFLVDLAWFSAVGYLDVFWTMFDSKVGLFVVISAGSTLFFWVNGTLAVRFSERRGHLLPVPFGHGSSATWTLTETLPERIRRVSVRLSWHLLVAGVAVVLGLLIAATEIGNWDLFLRFIYQLPYGQSDPLYGKDVGYYLFSLPAYVALKNWMLLTVVLGALVAGGVYFAHGDILIEKGRRWMSSRATAHGSALLGLFFAAKAWSYYLDRFQLLYGDNGIVVGAAYTDIHVELPLLWALVD
jgi:uncharacterized protein